jgi:copper chaperone CopZ
MNRFCVQTVRVLSASILLVALVSAADAPPATTLTIKGMHCGGCALKVAGKLQAVQQVQRATVNHQTGRATITAKVNQAVSPRALWEAVERAGYTPTQLAGPSGTYTKKPDQ